MKNYIPHIAFGMILGTILIMLFFSYSNYKEKSTVCAMQGGVLVNIADGFEEYACINPKAVLWRTK